MCKKEKSILEFHDVTWTDESHFVSDINEVSVALKSSELAVVLQQEHADKLPICDLASGLVSPSMGRVSFLEEDWSHMSACCQSGMRAKIGRVFDFSSWISNLTVYDNIVLSELHNTVRSKSEIHAEVEVLAKAFCIDEIPNGRPDAIRPVELRKCELVRAFIGAPDLLLLDRPESGLPSGVVLKLKDMLEKALDRGAAAIWITHSEAMWSSIDLRNTRKFRKSDKNIIEGERNHA